MVGELVLLAAPGKEPVIDEKCRAERIEKRLGILLITTTGLAFDTHTGKLIGSHRNRIGYDLWMFKLTPEVLSRYDGFQAKRLLVAALSTVPWKDQPAEVLQTVMRLLQPADFVETSTPVVMQRYAVVNRDTPLLPESTAYVIETFSGETFAVLANETRWRIPYTSFFTLKQHKHICYGKP